MPSLRARLGELVERWVARGWLRDDAEVRRQCAQEAAALTAPDDATEALRGLVWCAQGYLESGQIDPESELAKAVAVAESALAEVDSERKGSR